MPHIWWWRTILGGVLVTFTLGMYLGNMWWGEDAEPRTVYMDVEYGEVLES